MVKPSSRAGQRRNAISLRTTRGRLGSMRVVSAARTATPALAARRTNFRLVTGKKDNRFRAFCGRIACSLRLEHNPNRKFLISRQQSSKLETESGLQFDLAVGGSTGRERTA